MRCSWRFEAPRRGGLALGAGAAQMMQGSMHETMNRRSGPWPDWAMHYRACELALAHGQDRHAGA